MPRTTYPFSAIVGQDSMRLALLLAATDPSLGGVLVSGHKGTGKSTAVRALHALLPEIEAAQGCPYRCAPRDPDAMDAVCLERHRSGTLAVHRIPTPFVELPLNATEDRLAGTLNVEQALAQGTRRFEPGLLAAANRGLLYVDEVNLLDDHLVDLLLDAAASGTNVVEREGISHTHPARFVLLGTMNPEEGSLRPQFLDRFALFASACGIEDPAARAEIARRRLAFEADPASFALQWQDAQRVLADRIVKARENLRAVSLPDAATTLAVQLAIESGARGHRAEIAILKAARALAALLGKAEVETPEISDAARLVLPHRMKAGVLDSPERVDERLGDLIGRVISGAPEAAAELAAVLEEEAMAESIQVPGSFAAGSILLTVEKNSPTTGSSTPTSSPASPKPS